MADVIITILPEKSHISIANDKIYDVFLSCADTCTVVMPLWLPYADKSGPC